MAWLFLTIAVISNITSNMMFKLAMASFPAERSFDALLRFAFNPYLWIGGMSCVALLGCYLLALRDLGLMMSYVFVISLSMVGISLAAAFFLGEHMTLAKAAGMALVVSGVSLIASAQPSADPGDMTAAIGAEASSSAAN